MTSLEWNYLWKPWKRFKIHHILANRQFESIRKALGITQQDIMNMSHSLSKACSCSSPVNIWETSLLGPTILLSEYSRTSSNKRTKYLDVAKDAGEISMMAKKDPRGKMGLKKHFIWTKFLIFILSDAKYKIWYKTAIASLFTGEWWGGGWVVSRWVVSPKSTHTRIFIIQEKLYTKNSTEPLEVMLQLHVCYGPHKS